MSSVQSPVTFYGWPVTNDRAVTDRGQSGDGSGSAGVQLPWPTLGQTGPDPTACPSPGTRPTSNRPVTHRLHHPLGLLPLTHISEPLVPLPLEFNAGSLTGHPTPHPHPLVERGTYVPPSLGPAPTPAKGEPSTSQGQRAAVGRKGGPASTLLPPRVPSEGP